MSLQIIVDKKAKLDRVRHVVPSRARVFLAGSSEFHEHFEGLKGKKRVIVAARKGDTLAKVGSRYGMSVGSMERVNRRSRKTKLVQGEKLIVYHLEESERCRSGPVERLSPRDRCASSRAAPLGRPVGLFSQRSVAWLVAAVI